MVEAKLEQLVQRLEAAVSRQEALGAGGSAGGSAAASKPAGPVGALAGELLALTGPLLEEVKAKAAAIGNASVTQGTDFYIEAMKLQGALLTTMAKFRKPADISFAANGSPVVEMMQTVEAAGKKDRKSPMDVMNVLKDGFQLFFWNTTPGNDLLGDYLSEAES